MMKRTNILNGFLVVIILTSLFSCRKYLSEKSDNSLVVPTVLPDFQALLDRSYTMNMNTPSSGDASSDDYFLTPSSYTALDEDEQKRYKWQPTEYNYSNDWSFSYNMVYNANLCLEGVDKIKLSQNNKAAWNNVKGSALFYRAYAFLNMVWVHSKAYDLASSDYDLGIPLRLTSNPDAKTGRSSVSESYAQVLSDAKQSINYLPSQPSNVYRPSQAAAYGLVSRAYLSMRQYDSAFKYANLCLQIQNYLMDYNSDNAIVDLSINSLTSFKTYQFNKEIIFYSQPNQENNYRYQFYSGQIDSFLYNGYGSNDWRKTGFAFPMGLYFSFKGNYTGSNGTYFTGIATDEMYLIRAECYARAGNKDAALVDLNALMVKRWKNNGTWVPFTAVDATSALTLILGERRKELLYRGLRWIDIKRLNKEGRNIIPTRKLPDGTLITLMPNSNFYALALPKDIIDITGIPQNPY